MKVLPLVFLSGASAYSLPPYLKNDKAGIVSETFIEYWKWSFPFNPKPVKDSEQRVVVGHATYLDATPTGIAINVVESTKAFLSAYGDETLELYRSEENASACFDRISTSTSKSFELAGFLALQFGTAGEARRLPFLKDLLSQCASGSAYDTTALEEAGYSATALLFKQAPPAAGNLLDAYNNTITGMLTAINSDPHYVKRCLTDKPSLKVICGKNILTEGLTRKEAEALVMPQLSAVAAVADIPSKPFKSMMGGANEVRVAALVRALQFKGDDIRENGIGQWGDYWKYYKAAKWNLMANGIPTFWCWKNVSICNSITSMVVNGVWPRAIVPVDFTTATADEEEEQDFISAAAAVVVSAQEIEEEHKAFAREFLRRPTEGVVFFDAASEEEEEIAVRI